jgi:hypothetical protein
MALKYPVVDQLVIVVSDLYLPEEGRADSVSLPGLEHIARFGTKSMLAAGWRPWLARHVGCEALALEAPACVAARSSDADIAGAVWLATPVHLIAGLSSLHLEHRGLLKLPMAALNALAADFQAVFSGTDFALQPLASGGFLLAGPAGADAHAPEPARSVGMNMAAALPRSPALRRLGAEMELWLHEHPVNRARSERGELPVTALWLWGGGACAHAARAPIADPTVDDRAFGRDPYLDGLWSARGARVEALPASLADLNDTAAHSSVIVVELADLLAAERTAGMGDALGLLDERWIAPAADWLSRGALRGLTVIANDRCLSLSRHDALKRWRRARHGLAALA